MSLGWKGQAACRERTDLNWFGETPDPECEALCASCPVASPCLAEALGRHRDADPGMWGGTTPRERHAIREGTSWQRQLL
jgi:WhiB family redox-sensing transcriptional regulator